MLVPEGLISLPHVGANQKYPHWSCTEVKHVQVMLSAAWCFCMMDVDRSVWAWQPGNKGRTSFPLVKHLRGLQRTERRQRCSKSHNQNCDAFLSKALGDELERL